MPSIAQWQIYHVLNCRHTTPTKNKFVVVACVDGSSGLYHGLFINSDVNDFIQARPHLLVCQVEIFSSDHIFLRHDSWIDCNETKPFRERDLRQSRGELFEHEIPQVIQAVQNSRGIRRGIKNMILGNP